MRRKPVWAVCALLMGAVVGAEAQAAPPAPALTVMLHSEVPRVQSTGLLADGRFVALMRSGFPLRLHYRLDQFVRDVPWDAVARHDPLADDFVLIRTGGSTTRYATPEELARALEIPYTIPLHPPTGNSGRFYFLCRLEVSTLNDTDLEELSRWLRGDVGPAVSGEGNFGQALVRGAQHMLVRIAGLPRQRLEARSPTFRTERQSPP